MFNKKIEFIITDKNMEGVWPKPTPAMHAIPSEYKKLKRYSLICIPIVGLSVVVGASSAGTIVVVGAVDASVVVGGALVLVVVGSEKLETIYILF